MIKITLDQLNTLSTALRNLDGIVKVTEVPGGNPVQTLKPFRFRGNVKLAIVTNMDRVETAATAFSAVLKKTWLRILKDHGLVEPLERNNTTAISAEAEFNLAAIQPFDVDLLPITDADLNLDSNLEMPATTIRIIRQFCQPGATIEQPKPEEN